MASHFTPQLDFHAACSVGHDGLVVQYLRNGAVSVEGTTGGRTPLLEACWKGHASTAAILISAGSNVHAKDHEDFSCMHVAALHGYADVLELLLRHGANIEALDDGHSTPFGMAAFNFHERAMRLLADRGANISHVAKDKVSALNFACIMSNDKKVRLLLQLGATAKAKASAGVRDSRNAVFANADDYCLLQVIKNMWPPPAPAVQQESVQARASGCAWGRNLAIAEMLVGAGAKLEQRLEGNTPVHLAAGIGSRRLMTSLLRAGASPRSLAVTPHGVGSTALSWAAACSRPVTVRLLLQAGALEIRDHNGRLPREAIGSYVPSLPPAPQEELARRAVAVRHALLRSRAFRARSFLWPASGLGRQEEGRVTGRPWALQRFGRRETPAALAGMWRYANKAG